MALNMLSKLFLGFVAIIIGVSLIATVATGALNVTEKTIVYDESFNLVTLGCANATGGGIFNSSNVWCNLTVANYPVLASWERDNCPLTIVSVENTTDQTYALLIEGTDYDLFAATGIIHMLNTTTTNGATYGAANEAGDFNITYINYAYCADDYLRADWNRTVLNLVAGFFALAVMGIGIGLFYNVYKEARIGA